MAAMAPREDIVNSAVAFLQDPSVASSPLDKRRAFLESKNLTPDEIQLALARAGEDPQAPSPYAYPPPQQRGPPPPGYGYPAYPQQWPPAPHEPPRRDWRDWFIMATVTTGVGYGLYTLARRYVTPLIAPPTPPQLEADKSHIDAQFTKAFALIDQLATDTTSLKDAEEARNTRLDAALADIEAVLADLKAANAAREKQARRTTDDIQGLRDSIPQALQGWKAEHERRLGEVGSELRSLKMLVGNRVGVQAAGGNLARPAVGGGGSSIALSPSGPRSEGGRSAGGGDAARAATVVEAGDGSRSPATQPQPQPQSQSADAPVFKGPDGKPGFSFDSVGAGNKRAIPAWQLAASAASEGVQTGEA